MKKLVNDRVLNSNTFESNPWFGQRIRSSTEEDEYFRHLDCASVYQNERQVGQAIREAIEDFNISRTELFITSKLWNTHHHPDDVEPAFRKSIHDLGLDYLDLYLIHFPVAFENGNIPFPHSPDGKTKVEYNF